MPRGFLSKEECNLFFRCSLRIRYERIAIIGLYRQLITHILIRDADWHFLRNAFLLRHGGNFLSLSRLRFLDGSSYLHFLCSLFIISTALAAGKRENQQESNEKDGYIPGKAFHSSSLTRFAVFLMVAQQIAVR